MKKQLTPEQAAKAAERKAKFHALAREIGKLNPEQRALLAASCPAVMTIEGRALSVHNQCLVISQDPHATVVGGFRQWLKAGRCVRKGEHGLSIWVPSKAKAGEQMAGGLAQVAQLIGAPVDTEKPFFIMGTVFDVSQTEEVQAEQAAA